MNIGNENVNGLEEIGLNHINQAFWNLDFAELVEAAILHNEGFLSSDGALMVNTGIFTGRSPNDKYIVDYKDADSREICWGKVNQSITPENYEKIFAKVKAYLQNRDIYVQDLQVGADPEYRLNIRIVTEQAWHSMFARDLFLRPALSHAQSQKPDYTVIQVPNFAADPKEDEINSGTFIIINYQKKMVLIGNTGYAGEIKKSIFSVMNYLLPHKGVLPMHCSANIGKTGDTALFFGLSGTGKTTLSSDPDRKLIGDDEHGWGESGVFNFEGGCYAKTINLDAELEPVIWKACHRFGAVLENVVFDQKTREIDFKDGSYTENTRAAYPIHFIDGFVENGQGGHPANVFFLTADAFGVLPPLSKLTLEQAMYYFLSGYTSKLAGTEKGLGKEPQSTFSTCFGAPFLPLFPSVYAELLGRKIQQHGAQVWLINTGWSGGPYGVGSRIKLPYTRAMIHAALSGKLDNTPMRINEDFNLQVPLTCENVPEKILDPVSAWSDPIAYHEKAKELANHFRQNFKQFESTVSSAVINSGPK